MSTAPATKAPKTDLPAILIADDQPDVLEALRLLLKGEGFAIETAASPAQVLAALEMRDFAAVLIDLNYARDTTSGQEGLDLLQRVHTGDESLPVVVMTAWGSVNVAVEAMRRGARDFIQKPWENERLLSIVRTQTELGRAEFKAMTGLGERIATETVSSLVRRGYLVSDSAYGKLRFAVPRHALRFYFPALWPEAEQDEALMQAESSSARRGAVARKNKP